MTVILLYVTNEAILLRIAQIAVLAHGMSTLHASLPLITITDQIVSRRIR